MWRPLLLAVVAGSLAASNAPVARSQTLPGCPTDEMEQQVLPMCCSEKVQLLPPAFFFGNMSRNRGEGPQGLDVRPNLTVAFIGDEGVTDRCVWWRGCA